MKRIITPQVSYRYGWQSSFHTKADNLLVVKEYNALDKQYYGHNDFAVALQDLIISLGFLGACFVAIYQVTHHIKSSGDFIVLIIYWGQFQGNLTLYYRVNMQTLLTLL